MKEINSGKWMPGVDIGPGQVAAGIRSAPHEYIGRIPQETLFVACVGRDGMYRDPDYVEKISNILGFVNYVHLKPDEENGLLKDAYLLNDQDEHRGRWDSLLECLDIVYPDPKTEEEEASAEPPKSEEKKSVPSVF